MHPISQLCWKGEGIGQARRGNFTGLYASKTDPARRQWTLECIIYYMFRFLFMGRQLQKLQPKLFHSESCRLYKWVGNHLTIAYKTDFQTHLVGLTLTYSWVSLNSNMKNIRLPWVAKTWSGIVHSAQQGTPVSDNTSKEVIPLIFAFERKKIDLED